MERTQTLHLLRRAGKHFSTHGEGSPVLESFTLTLRALKAERLGDLLGDAVRDEPLMAQAGREKLERLLRYLIGGGVDNERLRAPHRVAQLATSLKTLVEEF